jgi:hypothetical protein
MQAQHTTSPAGRSPWRLRWLLLHLGIIGVVLGGPTYFLFWAVTSTREAAARLHCNLGGVGLALHNYQATHGRLPPAVVYSPDGKPLYSWRVLILPFIEDDTLFKEFNLDEPWDSPHNIALLPRMPKSYAAPSHKAGLLPPYHTLLNVFVGRDTPFEAGLALKIPVNLPEESGLLFVEAGEPAPWTKPNFIPYDPDRPLPELKGLFRDGFRGYKVSGGYHFVRRKDTNEAELRALIVRQGGSTWEVGANGHQEKAGR